MEFTTSDLSQSAPAATHTNTSEFQDQDIFLRAFSHRLREEDKLTALPEVLKVESMVPVSLSRHPAEIKGCISSNDGDV